MTSFIFETASELILFGFLPVLLTVATVWIVWRVLEKIDPAEVKYTRSFLTFVIVIVPFVMLNYGGLTMVIYDEMTVASGGWKFLPLPPSSLLMVAGVAIYIALTVWLWSHWRKLNVRQ